MRKSTLRWLGHEECKEHTEWIKNCTTMEAEGIRQRRDLRKTVWDGVQQVKFWSFLLIFFLKKWIGLKKISGQPANKDSVVKWLSNIGMTVSTELVNMVKILTTCADFSSHCPHNRRPSRLWLLLLLADLFPSATRVTVPGPLGRSGTAVHHTHNIHTNWIWHYNSRITERLTMMLKIRNSGKVILLANWHSWWPPLIFTNITSTWLVCMKNDTTEPQKKSHSRHPQWSPQMDHCRTWPIVLDQRSTLLQNPDDYTWIPMSKQNDIKITLLVTAVCQYQWNPVNIVT